MARSGGRYHGDIHVGGRRDRNHPEACKSWIPAIKGLGDLVSDVIGSCVEAVDYQSPVDYLVSVYKNRFPLRE